MPSPALLLLCLALVTAILYWRRPDAFYNPQLWAEDGSRFFTGVNFHGLETLVTPYAGYYHTYARLVALAGALVPYRLIPHFYGVCSYCVIALTVCYVFSRRLSAASGVRLAMGLAVVATTVGNEVFLNLANAGFLLALAWLLLAIADEPVRRSQAALDLALLALVGLSSPFAVCLWPLFGLRYITRRTRHSALLLAASLVVALVQVWNMPTRVPTGTAVPPWTPLYADALISRFGYVFLGQRILDLPMTDALRVAGTVVVVSITGWLLGQGIRRRNWAMVTMLAGSILAALLSTYVMRNALPALVRTADRHFFVPAVSFAWALILWRPRPEPVKWLPLGMILVAFLFLTPASKGQVLPDLNWAAQVDACANNGPVCTIPINPITVPQAWIAVIRVRTFAVPEMQTQFMSTSGDSLELLGFDMAQDQTLWRSTLVWRTVTEMREDYRLSLCLVDDARPDRIVARADISPFEGRLPTSAWEADEVILLPVELALEDVEPGRYQVRMGWHSSVGAEEPRLPAYKASGQRWSADLIVLPTVVVVP
ncbi:MAG: hypothetical protein GX557_10220 [Chloroflexi bacterium]|nr:hypothetical protein [Chloroflexota bacterium]